MMKKNSLLFSCLLLLLCLLEACGGDDYHYPSVKLEFLTVVSGADGSLRSVVTDEGADLPVVEDLTASRTVADTLLRVISNYEECTQADGTKGVRLYAVRSVVSPLPLPVDSFEAGIRCDPVEPVSLWMGYDYLNLLVTVREQGGEHIFRFVEEEVTAPSASGECEVRLTLYHSVEADLQDYDKRVYLSVPLRQYAVEGVRRVKLLFTLTTYAGEAETYEYMYVPSGESISSLN